MDYIFTIAFCPEQARPRYYNPDKDFKERSICQLRKKFKKDSDLIDEHMSSRDSISTIEQFEKKYKINVLNYGKKMRKASHKDEDGGSVYEFEEELDSDE